MKHVYISYHRDDSDFVSTLITQIEDAGFTVWADRERQRSSDIRWRASIDEAIHEAFAMVVVITPAARRSEQVNYEWMFALGSEIPVILLRLKPCALHPRQQRLRRVDFTSKALQPWGKLIGMLRTAHEDVEDDEDDDDPILEPRREFPARSRFRPRESLRDEDRPDRLDRPDRSERSPFGERLSPIERLRRARSTNTEPSPLFRPTRDGNVPVERLLKALDSDSREQRTRAVYQLGQSGDRSVIPALIKVLRDDDWRVREAAALALAQLKAVAAVPAMLETLRHARSGPFSSGSQTKSILQAIREVGPASLPVLIDALSDDEPRIRHMIVDLLGDIGDADAVPALITSLHDPESRVRWRAADALGRMGNAAAVPDLLAMLTDKDSEAQITAAWALGQIGHPSAVKPLIAMLHTRDWRTRWAAAQALWEIGADALPELIATLRDDNESVRNAAVRAIVEIGEPAIEPLIDALAGRDWDMRWSAASALGDIGDAAVPTLIEALPALDWQAAWAAAETLKRIGTEDALHAVAVWQQDHDAADLPASQPHPPHPSNDTDTPFNGG